jgi:ABC-type lipoprotein export system ATPase subunit
MGPSSGSLINLSDAPRVVLTVMGMATVVARGLVKTYGEGRAARRVLDGADLTVEPGEVVAVLGRSGSGKSTLLHLLGGLDRPEAGTIEVAGEPVTGAGERELSALRRRRIGFVFQFFHLLPELTGEANVLLAGRVRGAHPEAARRGGELIDRLGLRPVADTLPGKLSGGEQQRFAIARALVNDPALVLADEPTGNLDVEAGGEVLRLLRAGAGEGRAVVLVTHEPAAAEIADRVLTLRDGKLVA